MPRDAADLFRSSSSRTVRYNFLPIRGDSRFASRQECNLERVCILSFQKFDGEKEEEGGKIRERRGKEYRGEDKFRAADGRIKW